MSLDLVLKSSSLCVPMTLQGIKLRTLGTPNKSDIFRVLSCLLVVLIFGSSQFAI